MRRLAEGINADSVELAINELIMIEENKGGFQRGDLKPCLEELEKKYDVPFNTLKARYYRVVKDKVKPNVTKKGNVVVVKKDKDLDKKKVSKPKAESKTVTAPKTEPKTEQTPKETTSTLVVPAVAPIVKTETPQVITAKPLNVDESIMNFSQKPAEKLYNFPKDYYKLGQMVEVKVANVQSYGVFCEINDGRGFQALCHISEIVDGYIKKVTDYLDVGDIIQKAKIVLIENKRINVSMKHLHLTKKEEVIQIEPSSLPENPPVNVIGEQFGNLKDKLLARATEQKNDANEVEELFAQEGLTDGQKEIVQKYERDIEEMTSYLQEQLGALTSQAKLELASIIEEQGVFKTTRGILKTQENFRADIGLLFMRQMKEKLGECL